MSEDDLLQRILESPQLKVVKGPNDNGDHVAWCIFHADGEGSSPHKPDLYIGPKGYYCQVCKKGGSLRGLALELDIKVDDGLEDRHQGPLDDLEAVYDYFGEQGELLFQVVRKSGKRFLQRRPNGQGGWIWRLGDVRRVLYCLPRLLKATKENTILVVEGEKDADRLNKLGLVATTCPGGAGKWRPEYSEYLKGRHVIVLPDNDDPGRAHADQVRLALHSVAASTKIIKLPGLASGGDVSDWLDAGGTVEKLRKLKDDTPCCRPPLPTIMVCGRQLRDIIADSWEALRLQNEHEDPSRLFCQGEHLAYLGDDPDDAKKPNVERKPAILSVGVVIMKGMLFRAGNWVTIRKKIQVPSKPPDEIPPDMVKYRPLPCWLPPIESIISSPSYAPDLTFITPGYHRNLRLVYMPSIMISPPEKPTEKDLTEAVGKTNYLLTDFPFKDRADRANYIAVLLLSILRPAIVGSIPLVAIVATSQRSGKGALSAIFEILTTGTNASAAQYSPKEEEFRKALLPYILRGQPIIRLDNVADGAEFHSPNLASALTEGYYCDRVLGKSEVKGIPVKSVFLVTGNNITVSRDLLFRTLWTRLTPMTDEPDKRKFVIPEIENHVKEHRADYLTALATMVEYWKARGAKPWMGHRWNGFNPFVQMVGGVLEACGIEGFLKNADEQRAVGNPAQEEWRRVTQYWCEKTDDFRPATWLLKEIFDECEPLGYIRIRGENERGRARSLSVTLRKQLGRPHTLASGKVVSVERRHDPSGKRDLFGLVVREGKAGQAGGEPLDPLPPDLTRSADGDSACSRACSRACNGTNGTNGTRFEQRSLEAQKNRDTGTAVAEGDGKLAPVDLFVPSTLVSKGDTERVSDGSTRELRGKSPAGPKGAHWFLCASDGTWRLERRAWDGDTASADGHRWRRLTPGLLDEVRMILKDMDPGDAEARRMMAAVAKGEKLLRAGPGAKVQSHPGCYVCGDTRFWLSKSDKETCARCHPPACDELVKAWLGEEGDLR